jgi:tetratricopeptide (TPR) repeat protein
MGSILVAASCGGCPSHVDRIPPAPIVEEAVRASSSELPRDAALAFVRSRRAAHDGQMDRALEHLHRALAFDSSSAALNVRAAELEYLLGRSDNAVRHCRKALRLDPRHCEAHHLLGRISTYQLDLDPAEIHLRRAVECDPTMVDAWQDLAALLWSQERVEEYVLLLDSLEPYDDDDGWLLRRRGVALLELGEYDRAFEALKQAVEIAPEDRDALAVVLATYRETDRLDEAAVFLEGLIQRYPSVIELRADLVTVYAALGRHDDVIEQLLHEYEQDPDHRDHYAIAAADWLQSLMRYDEAVELLEGTLEEFPENSSLRLRLGHVFEAAGDGEAALDVWTEVEPGLAYWSFAVSERARVLSDLERRDEAIELLRNAVERDRADSLVADLELQIGLARTLTEDGQYDEAAAAVAPLEANAPSLFAREQARVLWESGQVDRALVLLNEAIERDGAQPLASLTLADLYRDQGLFAEGVAVLENAMARLQSPVALQQLSVGRFPTVAMRKAQIQEYEVEVLAALAFLQGFGGDNEAAVQTMRRVLRANPDDARALNYIGYTLAVMGRDLEEAEELLRRALTLQPLDPAIMDSLGWCVHRQGRQDEALELLEGSADRMPRSAVIWQHLGEVQLDLGRPGDARQSLRRCLDEVDERDPEERQSAQRAQELLQRLEAP